MPSGVKRRHQRIDAPLDVVIERQPFPALDWSMTGFAIAPGSVRVHEGQRLRFVARFHIRGALLSMPMDAEVARITPERIGCRFVDLPEDTVHLLRLLHAAHRTGRAPLWEGVLASAGGGAPPPEAATARRASRPVLAGGRGRRLTLPARWRPQRAVIAGVLALLAVVVIGFATTRALRDSESVFAVLSLPSRMMTAPAAGTVDAVLAAPGDRVGPQTPVLRLRNVASSGGAAAETLVRDGLVVAPCVCTVAEILVAAGAPVSPGTPLARLSAGEDGGALADLVVEALFAPEDAAGLAPGATLQVRLAGLADLVEARILPPQGGGGGAGGSASARPSALPEALTRDAGGITVLAALDRLPSAVAAQVYDGQPARVRLRRSLLGTVSGLFARLPGG